MIFLGSWERKGRTMSATVSVVVSVRLFPRIPPHYTLETRSLRTLVIVITHSWRSHRHMDLSTVRNYNRTRPISGRLPVSGHYILHYHTNGRWRQWKHELTPPPLLVRFHTGYAYLTHEFVIITNNPTITQAKRNNRLHFNPASFRSVQIVFCKRNILAGKKT